MSLKILHFSDIHTSSDKDENIILDRVDAIVGACASEIMPNDDVLVVLSGDIAASGEKKEYKIFENAFSDIVRKIKGECNVTVDVICVPGNHDCDFGTNTEIDEREKTICSLISERRDPTDDEINSLLSAQANYRAFESAFPLEKFNELVNVKHFNLKCGKVTIYMVNTSWISQKRENVNERFFPISKLDSIDNLSDDLVITVYHHPTHWFYPDNCVDFQNKIRSFSDLVIVGHEHRNDSAEISRNDSRYVILEGRELQNPSNGSLESGFSIYDINDELTKITIYHYIWNEPRYSKQIQDGEIIPFTRNLRRIPNVYNPNNETKKWMGDLELDIQHYRAENVLLDSIFVWPDLEVLDALTDDEDEYNRKVTSDHYNCIVTHPITLIGGESTSGKSTIAKMIYKKGNEFENCCVYIDASKITSYKFENLQKIIESEFISQYKNQDLEEFQQLSKIHKVLIVDNFHNLQFKAEKKSEIIKYFCTKFKSVILLSTLDIDYGMLIADCNRISIHNVALYRICPMGNRLRKEFISKWFRLGGSSEEDDEDVIGKKINDAIKYVDNVLGQYKGILPAYPVQMIAILQCQNSIVNNTQQISQYGYLYGSLVDASMGKRLRGEEINLYKGALSEISFKILIDRTVIDSTIDYGMICECIQKFSEEKLVPMDTDAFIEIMLETKILKQTDSYKYKFTYPYIYYYFTGSYISSHLNDKVVKNQIDYMCQRLYNESYGNIMIFVCYFSNNEDVIDQILLNSFGIFNNVKPYDFGGENVILQDAYRLIEQFTQRRGISSNDDVDKNQDAQLQFKDEFEIQDGTVSDDIDIKDMLEELSEEERKINSLYASLKTISVLGQIVKCYPGSISGERKVEIITEIHDLGMRTVNEMLSILGMLEQDFVEFFIQREQEMHPQKSTSEISLYVKNTYRTIMAQFVIGMVRNISVSFGGELSIMAAEKALSDSVSGKLVLHDLKMHYGKISIDGIINEYKCWQNNGKEFAAIALKYLTVNYLELNKCDQRNRERLCAALNVDRKKIMIESNNN